MAEANELGSLGVSDTYKVRNKDETGRLCAVSVCALCGSRRGRGPKFIALDARISSCLALYEPTENGRSKDM